MLSQSLNTAYQSKIVESGVKSRKTAKAPEYSGAFVVFSYYDDKLSLK
jgi:hypothetical protein